MNADVEMTRVVEDADFGVFGGGLRFDRFALAEVGDDRGGGPKRVLEGSVEARGVLDAGSRGGSRAGDRGLGLSAKEGNGAKD